MNKFVKTSALAATALFGMSAPMTAAAAGNPDMYVVVFRADWCGPCGELEPKLRQARNNLRDPKIEFVEFDFTDTSTQAPAYRASALGIVPQYNKWFPITGFAVMIDADTKRTLGCINKDYDAGSMTRHIRNLKGYAQSNRIAQSIGCPAPNR